MTTRRNIESGRWSGEVEIVEDNGTIADRAFAQLTRYQEQVRLPSGEVLSGQTSWDGFLLQLAAAPYRPWPHAVEVTLRLLAERRQGRVTLTVTTAGGTTGVQQRAQVHGNGDCPF